MGRCFLAIERESSACAASSGWPVSTVIGVAFGLHLVGYAAYAIWWCGKVRWFVQFAGVVRAERIPNHGRGGCGMVCA